jgi:hypothetical protein
LVQQQYKDLWNHTLFQFSYSRILSYARTTFFSLHQYAKYHYRASESLPLPSNMNTRATPSSSSQQLQRSRRSRVFLTILFVAVIIGMVVGLIFVAHHYYNMWGGQGFLKARKHILDSQHTEIVHSFLPLRQITTVTQGFNGFGEGWEKRSPSILPFYPCGDQQQSCEADGQPVSVPFF